MLTPRMNWVCTGNNRNQCYLDLYSFLMANTNSYTHTYWSNVHKNWLVLFLLLSIFFQSTNTELNKWFEIPSLSIHGNNVICSISEIASYFNRNIIKGMCKSTKFKPLVRSLKNFWFWKKLESTKSKNLIFGFYEAFTKNSWNIHRLLWIYIQIDL